jgi:hypothetical protein
MLAPDAGQDVARRNQEIEPSGPAEIAIQSRTPETDEGSAFPFTAMPSER